MDGRGAFKWSCGKTYEGNYKANKRHGFGIFTWPDGRKFMGEWVRGKQQGSGKFYNPETKQWYNGVWDFGKLVSFENPNDHTIIENIYNVDNDNNANDNSEKGDDTKKKQFSPMQNDYNFSPTNQNSLNFFNEESYRKPTERNNTATFLNPITDKHNSKFNMNTENVIEEEVTKNDNDVVKELANKETIKENDVNDTSTATKKKKKKKVVEEKEEDNENENKDVGEISKISKKKKKKKTDKVEDDAMVPVVEKEVNDLNKSNLDKKEKDIVDNKNDITVEKDKKKKKAKVK